jgi:hypothetical protein
MKILANKAATAVSLLLMFAMAVSLVALPAATAQEPTTIETYAFINATPNPVDVGQETLLHLGITRTLILADQGYEGITVTVWKPNNTTQTLGPFRTDSTGGTGTAFVPDQVGTYHLQTNFPAQWFNFTGVADIGGFMSVSIYLKASTSEKLALIVQEEPLTHWPGIPLPTEYWTRPIDAQAREWSVIAGNWLDGSRRNPQFVEGNDDAPETAHILWTMPETQGGLVGEPLGQHSFEIGDAYEGKFASRLILGGKLYYNKYAGPSIGNVDIYREYACVDLHTGEVLWSKVFLDNLTLARGQLMYWDTYDFHGVYDYLWAAVGSTWYAFDAFTGDWVYTMTNMPSGTITYGPKGEILIYTVDLRNGWMTMWNSTNIPTLYAGTGYATMSWGQWRPYGKTVNATGPHGVTHGGVPYNPPVLPTGLNGYQWNVSIPKVSVGSANYIYPLDRVICTDPSYARPHMVTPAVTEITSWGISLKPGQEGTQLFKNTWNAPASWVEGNQTIVFEAVSPESEDGVFVIGARDNRQHYGFSTETGDYLWVTEPEIYLNWYGTGGIGGERPPLIAYGKLFTSGIGGIVYAYDTKTGERLWTYNATDYYGESLFNTYWWQYPQFIADGKIYYGTLEHSPIDPRPRGEPFICLNTTTGEEIWRADSLFRSTLWGGLAIIGDSIIATQDTYDQRIYAIGKGPSATTVSAAPKISVHGDNVLVEGMVTDISPGTQEYALTARFPNGVPAVADENMSDWMLYVYKQFERPADAVGVEVVVEVLDPNNNFYEVGRTTSDASGFFSCAFMPEVPGKYTIIATFEGSEAYYGSFAETAINVEEAPAATPAPTPTPASVADMYLVPGIIGLIVAIAVVGAIIVLMLRKR